MNTANTAQQKRNKKLRCPHCKALTEVTDDARWFAEESLASIAFRTSCCQKLVNLVPELKFRLEDYQAAPTSSS